MGEKTHMCAVGGDEDSTRVQLHEDICISKLLLLATVYRMQASAFFRRRTEVQSASAFRTQERVGMSVPGLGSQGAWDRDTSHETEGDTHRG